MSNDVTSTPSGRPVRWGDRVKPQSTPDTGGDDRTGTRAVQNLEELRAAVRKQALELGLQVVDPNRRTPGTVRVRLDGAEEDCTWFVQLLEQRGVQLLNKSAPQPKREARGVMVYGTVDLNLLADC